MLYIPQLVRVLRMCPYSEKPKQKQKQKEAHEWAMKTWSHSPFLSVLIGIKLECGHRPEPPRQVERNASWVPRLEEEVRLIPQKVAESMKPKRLFTTSSFPHSPPLHNSNPLFAQLGILSFKAKRKNITF